MYRRKLTTLFPTYHDTHFYESVLSHVPRICGADDDGWYDEVLVSRTLPFSRNSDLRVANRLTLLLHGRPTRTYKSQTVRYLDDGVILNRNIIDATEAWFTCQSYFISTWNSRVFSGLSGLLLDVVQSLDRYVHLMNTWFSSEFQWWNIFSFMIQMIESFRYFNTTFDVDRIIRFVSSSNLIHRTHDHLRSVVIREIVNSLVSTIYQACRVQRLTSIVIRSRRKDCSSTLEGVLYR